MTQSILFKKLTLIISIIGSKWKFRDSLGVVVKKSLPMQETLVQSLVWEDPTCGRATKSMRHNYWACALGPGSLSYWASVWEPLKLACPRPRVLCNQRSYHNEKAVHRSWRVAPLAATREKACAAIKSQNNPPK